MWGLHTRLALSWSLYFGGVGVWVSVSVSGWRNVGGMMGGYGVWRWDWGVTADGAGSGWLGWGLYVNLRLVSMKLISGVVASGSPNKFSNDKIFPLLLKLLSSAHLSCAYPGHCSR